MSDLVQIQSSTAITNAVQQSSWGDEEEVVKPRYIALKQPKSGGLLENFKNGLFVDKEIGRSWSTIQMVILGVRLTRKWQSPYQPGEKRELYCRSLNRKTPVTSDDRFEPPAESCDTCAHGQMAWRRYQKSKNKADLPKNPCEQEVEILFIDEANPKQPYIYTVNGRGRENAEKMYKALGALSKDVLDRTGRRPEIYEYVVTMGSERQSDGNYTPKFTEISELTQEQAEERFGEAYKQFVIARREAYAARQQAGEGSDQVNESLNGGQNVEETPATPAKKPQSKPEYLPPAKNSNAGAKPVYAPPAVDGDEQVPAGQTAI